MKQVLCNFENGNNSMQAVEGKMTGLTNQCRGLANRRRSRAGMCDRNYSADITQGSFLFL